MATEVALETFHDSVDCPPSSLITVGLAVKEFITGIFPTLTVAVSVTEPLPFVAVIVYVVVTVGDIDCDPLSVDVPTPTSGVICMLAAFVDVQVRIVEEPSAMVDGSAVNDTVGRFPTVT